MKHFYLFLLLITGLDGFCADIPTHDPLRILIVSDEVNPHNLSNSDLTQPGDLLAALSHPDNGLNIDTVVEIPTNDIHLATALLNIPVNDSNHFDVLIYFSHRIPNDDTPQQNQTDQDNFTNAVEAFLQSNGGVIAFHHGLYYASGKEGILSIIGATANGSVPWNTTEGQNVINVSPQHFIADNEVEYPSQISYADVANGIASSTYSYFNNTPDERYPFMSINNDVEDVEILFASDYDQNGTTHILGYTHKRNTWTNLVFAYQPGEYQPNVLDDFEGNNFQILANAIYYLATYTFPVGINETYSQTTPYPNPFVLGIKINESIKGYEVYDLSGRLVESSCLPTNHTIIGQNWKDGYYLLRLIKPDGSIQNHQLIKQ